MHPKTKIKSILMNFMGGDLKRKILHAKAGYQRRLARDTPHVLYFHQVDDPYSHLVVQKLAGLRQKYSLEWRPVLVSGPEVAFQGDASRFSQWALQDAKNIACFYSVKLGSEAKQPSLAAVNTANNQLYPEMKSEDFAEKAIALGDDLWHGKLPETTATNRLVRTAIRFGNQVRKRKGHYLGGMFFYEGEWYWGLDRMYLLEDRLHADGFASSEGRFVPPPSFASATGLDASELTLEYFPSLRSPYTAVGHARVMDLVRRSGITLKIRPVMPMMMRGVPAPLAKQQYIISDSGREARANKVPFGNIVDPFGEPVRRAFALYPWCVREQKSEAFVTAYLSAAWAQGTDITTDAGLRQVIESIGLTWQDALKNFTNDEWQPLLDENVADMLTEGLWGVPSFKVSGIETESFSCWGQDRIWRVEAEITRRMKTLGT